MTALGGTEGQGAGPQPQRQVDSPSDWTEMNSCSAPAPSFAPEGPKVNTFQQVTLSVGQASCSELSPPSSAPRPCRPPFLVGGPGERRQLPPTQQTPEHPQALCGDGGWESEGSIRVPAWGFATAWPGGQVRALRGIRVGYSGGAEGGGAEPTRAQGACGRGRPQPCSAKALPSPEGHRGPPRVTG